VVVNKKVKKKIKIFVINEKREMFSLIILQHNLNFKSNEIFKNKITC
jgi:hypothetical protein